MSLETAMFENLFEVALIGVFSVLWWLLRNKDDKEQRELEDFIHTADTYREIRKLEVEKKFDQIWTKQRDDYSQLLSKHEIDARELAELRERIAREYYVKQEMDNKFDKLERVFTDGLKDLGLKFDRLGEIIARHQSEERP